MQTEPDRAAVRPWVMEVPSDAFIEGIRGRLVGALTLSIGDAAVAEEVAQDTLAKAVLHWGRVSGMASPTGWVFMVAFNIARSRFRRRAAERRAYDRLGERPSSSPGPETAVTDAVTVLQAVYALPPRQRQVIAARFYADLSVAEAAAVMGCAQGTVKSLTSEALANLRARGGMEVDIDV